MIYLFSSAPKTIVSWLTENSLDYQLITTDTFADFVANMPKFGTKDFGISYDYGKIFPDELLAKLKIINIHFSLLPKYRGAVPVEASILNNDAVTGITFQWTDKLMDVGNILLQKEVKIENQWTSGELQAHMDSLLPGLLTQLLSQVGLTALPGTVQTEPSTYCYTKLLNRSNAYIHFDKLFAKEVEQRVKAFNPEPYAWVNILFNGKQTTMNIMRGTEYKWQNPQIGKFTPKQITWVKGKGMVIECLQGSFLVTQMVIAGSKMLQNGDIVSLKGKISIE